MLRETLNEILAAREAKRPVVLVSDLESGEQHVFHPDAPPGGGAPAELPPALRAACMEALRADRSRMTPDEAGRSRFLHVFNPPLRMVVVGAVHITQALAPMGALLGYEVTVVDPRRAFASDERFPGVAVDTDWPDDALRRLTPDRRTAVVTLTHDPKLDDPALEAALASGAFYIGSLGSRRTHAARLERLRARGFDEPALRRIHGPIGLAIGAKSPAEIAAAVVAQMTAVLRAPPAEPAEEASWERGA